MQPDSLTEEQLIEARWKESLRPAAANPWFTAKHVYRIHEQERAILQLLRRAGCTELERLKILDIGCGSGGWLQKFLFWGARPENLHGVDLIAERIAQARQLFPPTVTLQAANAAALDYADGTFDVVVMSLVLSLMADPVMLRRVATEAVRVLKPGGAIIWYDYRYKPARLQVRGIGKAEIASLFAGCTVKLKSITPIPPIRALARYSLLLSLAAGKLPLHTHYVGVIRKAGNSDAQRSA